MGFGVPSNPNHPVVLWFSGFLEWVKKIQSFYPTEELNCAGSPYFRAGLTHGFSLGYEPLFGEYKPHLNLT